MAAFRVVWLPFDVRGFRSVLACGWHDAFWLQTAKLSATVASLGGIRLPVSLSIG